MVQNEIISVAEPAVLEETNNIYDLFTFLYNMDELVIAQKLSYDTVIKATNKFTDYVKVDKKNILEKVIKLPKKYSCTCLHSINTMILTILLCLELELDDKELYVIARAAFFHDIGKKYIPDSIIEKTGRLTESEYEDIKMHPIFGYTYVQRMFPMAEREVKEAVLLHHGTLDERGYPRDFTTSGIPVAAQIVSIVDKFEAYTGPRAYHPTRTVEEGVEFIQNEKNLNKKFVNAFCNVLKKDKFSEIPETDTIFVYG